MTDVTGVWVACPMGLEFRAVAGLLEEAQEVRVASRPLVSGLVEGVPVTVCRTGWGKAMAASGAQLLLDRWPGSLLLDVGTCGALSAGLEVGDLFVASRVTDADLFDSAHLARYSELRLVDGAGLASLIDEMAGRLGRRPAQGRMLCQDRTVDSQDERARWESAGFDAVCWETFSVAKVAESNGVAALSVRVVSDRADGAVVETFQRHRESFLRRLAEAVRTLLVLAGRSEELEAWHWRHASATQGT